MSRGLSRAAAVAAGPDGAQVLSDGVGQSLAKGVGPPGLAARALLDDPLDGAHREGDAAGLDDLQVDRAQPPDRVRADASPGRGRPDDLVELGDLREPRIRGEPRAGPAASEEVGHRRVTRT